MTDQRVSFGRLWPLMLTVFVDMVGWAFVFPIAPFFAKRLGATPFVVGLLPAVYALAQLITAPLWGRVSDLRGRRPVLLLGISIAGVAHLIFAFASSNWAMARFDNQALLAILLLSRLVGGAGGASTGIVQAFVGDAIRPEERAKAFGWISAATSAGIMFGPALGSLATNIGPAFPGLVAATLCVVNLGFAQRFLHETTSHETRAGARSVAPGLIRARASEVLQRPRRPVSRLIWIYAFGMMAFAAMNAMLALFLDARFGFTEKTIGWAYSGIGVVGVLMRVIILDPTVRWLGERGVMRLGLAALTVSLVLQPFAPSLVVYGFVVLLVPIGTALLFPANSSLVTRFIAERHELGAIMGVQQTYGGVARLIGPLWSGWAFQQLGSGAPFFLCAGLTAITYLVAIGLEAPPRLKSQTPPAEPAAAVAGTG